MKRSDKEALASQLNTVFNEAQVGFLADYKGLSVEDVTALRRQLHEVSTEMRVLKNRIAKIAAKDTPFAPLLENLVQTRAFIYGQDPMAPAKVISGFKSSNEKFTVLKGLLITSKGATLLDAAQVKALGNLPSREELLGKLLAVLNAPLSGLLTGMNAIPATFVRTLAALAEQKRG